MSVLLATLAHLSPKRSVWIVSTACRASMDAVTTTTVFESPPSADDSSIVSRESCQSPLARSEITWYGM
eukprot:7867054-Pyramimonas_sp.AAC.1